MLPAARLVSLCAAALGAVLALAEAAAAQELPDGSYACRSGSAHLGDIEISGSRYRGPGSGGAWGSFRRVGPAIIWDGALGAISAAGEVVGTTLGEAGAGFAIQIKRRDSGEFQLVTCRK